LLLVRKFNGGSAAVKPLLIQPLFRSARCGRGAFPDSRFRFAPQQA
jgi:hypothetical protein